MRFAAVIFDGDGVLCRYRLAVLANLAGSTRRSARWVSPQSARGVCWAEVLVEGGNHA